MKIGYGAEVRINGFIDFLIQAPGANYIQCLDIAIQFVRLELNIRNRTWDYEDEEGNIFDLDYPSVNPASHT